MSLEDINFTQVCWKGTARATNSNPTNRYAVAIDGFWE